MDAVRHALALALDRRDLSEAEAAAAVGAVMDGGADEALVAALLAALRTKGETAAELVGAARAMRQRASRIPARRSGLLDTCGTGGDGLRTFNISTATAIAAAAAGAPVAKHGNRSASSSSGSADVLEALGVNLALSPDQVADCIEAVGLGFCFAPALHGAMRNVAGVRKRLGFRTLFNLLGPLTNPAGAEFQIVGASSNAAAGKLATALAGLGTRRAVIVCGNEELDEVCLWGLTAVFLVEGGTVTRSDWDAAAAVGGSGVTAADLQVSSPAESAAVIREVFSGADSPARRIVLANAAAALFAAGRVSRLADGIAPAAAAIDSGAAAATLEKLVKFTNDLAPRPV